MNKSTKTASRAGFVALVLSLPLSAMAQGNDEKLSLRIQNLVSTDTQAPIAAFVYFVDKGDNIAAKLIAAQEALSPPALQRRIINRGAGNVVGFNDIPINPDYFDAIVPQVMKVRHQLKMLNAVSVEATPAALAEIAEFAFVKKITLVIKAKRAPEPEISPAQLQAEAALLQPDGVHALDYGASYTQNNQINVPAVHDLGYDGSGVVIAIFDAGFNRLSHESFGQMNIAGAWDFVNGDGDVGDGSDMGEGSHGTNTLSTVGGYSPGDLIGPAYGATYYLAKTENTESELHVEEDNWCAAAEWADTNGAQIITSSLGYRDFDSGGDYTSDDMDGDTTIVTQCADLAATNGIVVINSAGNDGSSSSGNTLGAPSDGHFVLGVGAVTSSGNRSSFSSVGPSADGRIKPDVMAMGSSVRAASSFSDTGYTSVSGTSFSCPLTAGVAGLVLQAVPTLTAAQFRDALRNSADNAGSPNNTYGYGIINALATIEASGGLPLTAAFTYTSSLLEATFTDTSSAPTGATITAWAWDFGDGSTSTLQNPVHTYAAAGSYNVTLTVTDSEAGTDSVTNAVTVTDTLQYCASKGNNVSDEWVAQVDVGSFSNSSGAAGYSDFTSLIIDLQKGNANAVSLLPGFASTTYAEYWTIWIDYNKDGDFADSGESVLTGSGSSTVTGSFTVPSSAITGTTTMRVSMKYNAYSTPCETFSYGEVEDYTVNLSDGQPAVDASFTFTTDGLGASFTDTSTATGTTITSWSWSFGDGASSTVQNPTYTYAADGTYTVTLTVGDDSGLTDSANQDVTVSDVIPAYCDSQGNNQNYEWAAQVDVGAFSNASGASGYSDFSSMVIDLTAGQSTTTTLSPGFASSSYREYWKIWIDYNQDGDFADTGEEVFAGDGTGNVSGSFTVPTSANAGQTRLRVSMQYNSSPGSCGSFSYGEVEDYTASIGN